MFEWLIVSFLQFVALGQNFYSIKKWVMLEIVVKYVFKCNIVEWFGTYLQVLRP